MKKFSVLIKHSEMKFKSFSQPASTVASILQIGESLSVTTGLGLAEAAHRPGKLQLRKNNRFPLISM